MVVLCWREGGGGRRERRGGEGGLVFLSFCLFSDPSITLPSLPPSFIHSSHSPPPQSLLSFLHSSLSLIPIPTHTFFPPTNSFLHQSPSPIPTPPLPFTLPSQKTISTYKTVSRKPTLSPTHALIHSLTHSLSNKNNRSSSSTISLVTLFIPFRPFSPFVLVNKKERSCIGGMG